MRYNGFEHKIDCITPYTIETLSNIEFAFRKIVIWRGFYDDISFTYFTSKILPHDDIFFSQIAPHLFDIKFSFFHFSTKSKLQNKLKWSINMD